VTTVDAHALLTISEVAARSGFAASALRFYEDEGLIAATRTSGGQRRYQRSVLRRLAFIRAAGNVGLTLDDIRAELDRLPGNRTPTRTDWARITRHWRGRLDEQIAALERLRDGLESCIGCGCLSLKQCAISNPADAEGDGNRRAGARLLPRALRAKEVNDPPRARPR
jgi:MerR family redox-sensitive transcriptional activator SoxR